MVPIRAKFQRVLRRIEMGRRGGVAENGVDDTCFASEVADSGLVRSREEKWGISVEVGLGSPGRAHRSESGSEGRLSRECIQGMLKDK